MQKAQVALEYLTTYGLVIIIVLLSIGALFYIGVSPYRFLSDECILPTGFRCSDFSVTPTQVFLVIENYFGKTITVKEVVVTNNDGASCSLTPSKELKSSHKANFRISNCNNGKIGEKFKGDINIDYSSEDSGITHTASGILITKIIIALTTICENAQSGDLCIGLDIVFGDGYSSICCEELNLCC